MDVICLQGEGRGVEEERRGGAAGGHVQITWWVVSGRVSEGFGAALEQKSSKYSSNEENHHLKLQQKCRNITATL